MTLLQPPFPTAELRLNFPAGKPIAFMPQMIEPETYEIINNPCEDCAAEPWCVATPFQRKWWVCREFAPLVYWKHNCFLTDRFMAVNQTYTYANITLERCDMEVLSVAIRTHDHLSVEVLRLRLHGEYRTYEFDAEYDPAKPIRVAFDQPTPADQQLPEKPMRVQPRQIIRAHIHHSPPPEERYFIYEITILAPSKFCAKGS